MNKDIKKSSENMKKEGTILLHRFNLTCDHQKLKNDKKLFIDSLNQNSVNHVSSCYLS